MELAQIWEFVAFFPRHAVARAVATAAARTSPAAQQIDPPVTWRWTRSIEVTAHWLHRFCIAFLDVVAR